MSSNDGKINIALQTMTIKEIKEFGLNEKDIE